MADRRLELHAKLKTVLGSNNVYFQAPSNLVMQYPCIRYERSKLRTIFADGFPYSFTDRYQLTLMVKDPDSPIFRAVASLQGCIHERSFNVDGLYHHIFNITH
jgi:hypothetical protein